MLGDDLEKDPATRPQSWDEIVAMVADVQQYVPGYQLKNGPIFEGRKVTIFLEVEGLGDFLPKYAGNLDIMTAAGVRTAEMFAKEILEGRFVLEPVKENT